MNRSCLTLVAFALLCEPVGAQDSKVTQTGAWYVMHQKDAMSDELETTLITQDAATGQRLANSPVTGDFGFLCRSGEVVPALLVKVRLLAPIISEAAVQVRVAGGTPSEPANWEPRSVSSGVALRGQDGVALAERLLAAAAQDSTATFVMRASINDDERVTFTFRVRGFTQVWKECPHGSTR